MWCTELAGHNVGHMDMAGSVKEFPVPGESGNAGIAAGHDGRLWFTHNDIAQVASMSTSGKLGKTYPTRAYPFGIVAGPDGRIWIYEGYGDAIGRLGL